MVCMSSLMEVSTCFASCFVLVPIWLRIKHNSLMMRFLPIIRWNDTEHFHADSMISSNFHNHNIYKSMQGNMNQIGLLFVTQRTGNWVLVFRKKTTKIVNATDYSWHQQRIRRHNNYRLSQTELSYSYFCWIAHDKKEFVSMLMPHFTDE